MQWQARQVRRMEQKQSFLWRLARIQSNGRAPSEEFAPAQTAGVVMMVVSMHNLAHWATTPMALMSSPERVGDVQCYVLPNWILFGGVSFVICDGSSFQPQMPMLLEMDPWARA